MKIKLSKTQWQFIGKQAGWSENESQEQKMFHATVANITNAIAKSIDPLDPDAYKIDIKQKLYNSIELLAKNIVEEFGDLMEFSDSNKNRFKKKPEFAADEIIRHFEDQEIATHGWKK